MNREGSAAWLMCACQTLGWFAIPNRAALRSAASVFTRLYSRRAARGAAGRGARRLAVRNMGGDGEWDDVGSGAADLYGWPDHGHDGAAGHDDPATDDRFDQTAGPAAPPAPHFSVTLGPLQPVTGTTPHGTTGAYITVHVTNTGPEIPDAALVIWFNAAATDASSEHSANFAHPLGRYAVGEGRGATGVLQLDPGTWTVIASVRTLTDDLVAVAEPVSVVIAGHVGHSPTADPSEHHDVAVAIDTVTHEDSLYRIHYTLRNLSARPVPAGLPVSASLTGVITGSHAEQEYTLQTGLPPHGHAPHYLTVENPPQRDSLVARITVHVGAGQVKTAVAYADTDDSGAVIAFTRDEEAGATTS